MASNDAEVIVAETEPLIKPDESEKVEVERRESIGSERTRTRTQSSARSILLSVTVNNEEEEIGEDGSINPRMHVQSDDGLSLGTGGEGHADSRPVAMAHCHVTPRDTGMDKKARFRLLLASFLCLIFMIGECVGGVLAHSLAVVSDAAHLLTDFASFMISLMALYLASRPATKRLSFGWHRAEILGALVSILMLWVITGVLAYSAVLRIESGDYEINATIMLITSATGVFFNVVLGCTLHQHGHSHGGGGKGHSHDGHSHDGHSHDGHGHDGHSSSHTEVDPHVSLPMEVPDNSPLIADSSAQGYGSISSQQPTKASDEAQAKAVVKKKKKDSNINVKAAFIHVVGDFTQSVGVLIAAFIIFFKPEWKIADPICTFLFSALVLITTITIMRDILVVLMEGTPRNINFEEVRDSILDIDGVKDLHDLRVWSLTMDKTALSVHLAVERGLDPMQVVQATSRLIQYKYNITQTTIQVEEYVEEMRDCTRCQDLKD